MSAAGRLNAAMIELVKSASIKQRLATAFSDHLRDLDPADLPPESRADFAELLARLEAVRPQPGESAVQATVRKMSPAEADACAARVVELYASVVRVPAAAVVTRIPPREKRDDAAVVPLLFAAEA